MTEPDQNAEEHPENSTEIGRTQSRTQLSKVKRKEFLKLFAKTGNISGSARAVGLSRQGIYDYKAGNPIFAKAWDNAWNEYLDTVEAEVQRRGAEGFLEPVFYQGKEVAQVRKYSDNLLMFYLKAKRPEFRDKSVEVNFPSIAMEFNIGTAPQISMDPKVIEAKVEDAD